MLDRRTTLHVQYPCLALRVTQWRSQQSCNSTTEQNAKQDCKIARQTGKVRENKQWVCRDYGLGLIHFPVTTRERGRAAPARHWPRSHYKPLLARRNWYARPCRLSWFALRARGSTIDIAFCRSIPLLLGGRGFCPLIAGPEWMWLVESDLFLTQSVSRCV